MSSARDGVSDLRSLPVILTLEDVARVYRKTPAAVRRALQRHTFQPKPYARYPYRWLRDAVIRDVQVRLPKLTTGAVNGRRPVKAGTR